MLVAWENLGGKHVMGTLTMRHHKGHSLDQEWTALSKGWNSVSRSQVWRKWKGRLGSPGLIKVVECNYGCEHGWHVHLHFVLLVDGSCSEADVRQLSGWLFPKWERSLHLAGMPGALSIAQDLHLVDGVEAASQVGEYLNNATAYGTAESLGRELHASWSKQARSDHKTVPHWRLIEEFAETGDTELLALWHEWERDSKRHHQYEVSKGLRDLLLVGPEKSDEEIAAEEVGDRDLVQISPDGWRQVLAANWLPSKILEVMESDGPGAVCRFLTDEGIDHWEVTEEKRQEDERVRLVLVQSDLHRRSGGQRKGGSGEPNKRHAAHREGGS
jgi:hypothetical protein